MLDPAVGILIDLGGAALLASAAAHKLRRSAEFFAALTAYDLVPAFMARAVATALPLAEAAIAAALIVPAVHREASLAAAILLLGYAFAIAANLLRGRRDLDCGCAGPGHRRAIGAWMVWRNLALAAAFALAATRWRTRSFAAVDLLTVAAGLAAAALLYFAIDLLAGEIAPRGSAMRSAP